MRLFWLSATLAFAADQLSKLIVVHWLDLKTILAMDPFPPFLRFRMGWNTGINFGLFSDAPDLSRWLLVAVAVGVSALVWRWARGFPRPVAVASAGILVGGALANALDRVIYGAVADFLNMSCCGIDNPFAFNIADVFIFAGAIGLVIWGEDRRAKAP
jgi:signal peptidase II